MIISFKFNKFFCELSPITRDERWGYLIRKSAVNSNNLRLICNYFFLFAFANSSRYVSISHFGVFLVLKSFMLHFAIMR